MHASSEQFLVKLNYVERGLSRLFGRPPGGPGGRGGGRAQNIMRALCAVIRPDHFKFASYGPAMVGTGWANSCPGCMDRLRKCHSHLLGSSFLAGKAAWALSGCLITESADYCMLVNKWAWLKSRVCLSGLGFSFGVRAWTEMEIRCVKGMYRLKLVSSEKKFRV